MDLNLIRKTDRMRLWLACIALVQLSTGTLVILAQHPSTADVTRVAVEQQRQQDQMGSITARLTAIEALHIEGRLAVLDDMRERVNKVELLMYGSILTLIINLIGTVVQIRGAKEGRRS